MRDDTSQNVKTPRLPRAFTFFVSLPLFRSQRAYYSRFFFSEEGRDVFVGGYGGSSILCSPRPPLSMCLYLPSSTTPFAGSKGLRRRRVSSCCEGESSSFSFLFLSFVSLHPRRDTFTYICALVTLVGASFLGNLHPERAPH